MPSASIFEGVPRTACAPVPSTKKLVGSTVRILTGRAAILAHTGVLEQFASACGQPTAMHGLQFLLDHAFAARKTAHLVCLLSAPCPNDELTLERLLGCALFFEYRLGRLPLGLVATGDSSGVRSVIGPAELRAQIAMRAACRMLEQAAVVLASFRQDRSVAPVWETPPGSTGMWCAPLRELRDGLPLRPSLEETLATLGKRTRTHLRYYRKRVAEELKVGYVADAHRVLSPAEAAQLNERSLNPLAPAVFNLQFRAAAELPGGFIDGMRAADGQWLSLAGGWRQDTTTLIQWQANAAGFEKLSLGTAFRAFLLEHEVQIGTTRLCFHNGTSHSMQHAFPPAQIVDLLLRRSSPMAKLACRLVPALARSARTLKGNILATALDQPLVWKAFPAPRSQPGRRPTIR